MIQILYVLACAIPAVWLGVSLFMDLGANPVELMLHTSGEWALNFLLLTLTVTPVRRLIRLRYNWVKLRRTLGLSVFAYAVTHFTIFVIFELDVSKLVEEIIERKYILVGFVALCVLLPLAITSTNGWQKRLRRKWLVLHRGVYIATTLAIVHYYMQVKADYFFPLVYGAVFLFLMLMRLPGKKWLDLLVVRVRHKASGQD